jgi:hypothetical protein
MPTAIPTKEDFLKTLEKYKGYYDPKKIFKRRVIKDSCFK